MLGVTENGDENPTSNGNLPLIQIRTSAREFATLSQEFVTNSIILKLASAAGGRAPTITWNQIATLMLHIYGTSFPGSSLRSNFNNVQKKERKLKKKKSDKKKLDSFYEETYTPPKLIGKQKMFSMTDVVEEEPELRRPRMDPFEKAARDIGSENAELIRKMELQKDEAQRLKQANTYNVERLNAEIEKLKQENANLTNALTATKQRLTHVYTVMGKINKPKHLMQSIQRKNISIARWRSETIKWRKAAKTSCKPRLQSKSEKLKALQSQNSNRKCRAKKVKQNQTKQPNVNTKVLTHALKNSIKKVNDQNKVISEMENVMLQNEENRDKIQTRILGNRINPTMKETSMYLQELGVAEGNVGPAIDRVITTLTDMEFDEPLPSKSSQQRVSSEMRAVARQHIREGLHGEKNLTLKYDGTTKNGHHLVEVQVASEKETYTLGIQETAGGTANDYVECIVELANNVDTNIMPNISNTMTDRCITNNAIDRQLEQQTGNKINSFRCAVHPLDTIHKQVEKKVKEKEHTLGIQTDKEPMPYMNRGESTTQALLRAFDKVMHCSASGLPKELPYFLQSIGLGGKYPRWVGNRFNIFFVNAGLIYLYKEHVQHFFQKVILPRNNLHHAIYNALRIPTLLPILRSLGLLDKFLTGPWMRWQGETHNILETCVVFTAVVKTLDDADCNALIHGFDETAFGTTVKADAVYTKLIEPSNFDIQTALTFRCLLDEASKVMTRQLEYYLPGGKFHNPSPTLQAEAASCSSNNISGERVFAMWDSRKMQGKTASLVKVSSKTTFKANKVREHFLAGKSKEEKARIIHDATSVARKDRIADKARETKLKTRMKDKLDESRKLIEKREENRREYKEKILEDVLKHGLWQSEQDVHQGLQNISKTRACSLLKSQIRFRVDMVGCQPARKILFSKASQQELTDYLIELFQDDVPESGAMLCNVLADPESIVGFEFNQKWSTGYDDNMCRGTIMKCVQEPGNDVEYVCTFEGENDVTVQTVAEVLADMAVGDLYFYV